MAERPKRRGAPPKVPGGLGHVLFVRVPENLIIELDSIAETERARHPGRSVSRADVARELLFQAAAKRRAKGAGR